MSEAEVTNFGQVKDLWCDKIPHGYKMTFTSGKVNEGFGVIKFPGDLVLVLKRNVSELVGNDWPLEVTVTIKKVEKK